MPATLKAGLEETECIVRARKDGRGGDPPTDFSVRLIALRRKLKLTQRQFSDRYGLKLGTVRNWEQGRSSKVVPDAAAALLLRVIESDPDGVAEIAALEFEDA